MLCYRVPVKRILNIDHRLKNLPIYNQHLNGITLYYIIVTLKYNNCNLMLRACRKEGYNHAGKHVCLFTF